VQNVIEDYAVLTNVCIKKNIVYTMDVMDVLLAGIQLFKTNNCVIILLKNIEMCIRYYTASCHRKYCWMNVLYKKGIVKPSHSHKCNINMFMDLNNCTQIV
jgi:hypothetical protein